MGGYPGPALTRQGPPLLPRTLTPRARTHPAGTTAAGPPSAPLPAPRPPPRDALGPAHGEAAPPPPHDRLGRTVQGAHWLQSLLVPRPRPTLAPAHSCEATWPPAGPPPLPRRPSRPRTRGQGARAQPASTGPAPAEPSRCADLGGGRGTHPPQRASALPWAKLPCQRGLPGSSEGQLPSDPPNLGRLELHRFHTFQRQFLKLASNRKYSFFPGTFPVHISSRIPELRRAKGRCKRQELHLVLCLEGTEPLSLKRVHWARVRAFAQASSCTEAGVQGPG